MLIVVNIILDNLPKMKKKKEKKGQNRNYVKTREDFREFLSNIYILTKGFR